MGDLFGHGRPDRIGMSPVGRGRFERNSEPAFEYTTIYC